MKNIFDKVVQDFGEEWSHFDYSKNDKENLFLFKKYFDIFPKKISTKKFTCLDVGCGTGRFSKILAPKVKHLTLLDPSKKALLVAKKNLKKFKNISFFNTSVSSMNFKKKSFDFVYSLGVLHHIPDLDLALRDINKILKKNGLLLIYLYYRFDNKPFHYKIIWKISELLRYIISNLPFFLKKNICFLITVTIYLPLAIFCKILKKFKIKIENIPLNQYHDKSFYVMLTDTVDRFGTKYEKRYTRKEIREKLIKNGFEKVKFSKNEPYWHAIAFKRIK